LAGRLPQRRRSDCGGQLEQGSSAHAYRVHRKNKQKILNADNLKIFLFKDTCKRELVNWANLLAPPSPTPLRLFLGCRSSDTQDLSPSLPSTTHTLELICFSLYSVLYTCLGTRHRRTERYQMPLTSLAGYFFDCILYCICYLDKLKEFNWV
jgi:hypothetical protein